VKKGRSEISLILEENKTLRLNFQRSDAQLAIIVGHYFYCWACRQRKM